MKFIEAIAFCFVLALCLSAEGRPRIVRSGGCANGQCEVPQAAASAIAPKVPPVQKAAPAVPAVIAEAPVVETVQRRRLIRRR